jgi:hypothetical protein
MMPGAEYLVILNDRQLREAQMRQHSRTARSRARRLTLPRPTWLLELARLVRPRFAASDACPSEQVAAQSLQSLFGSTD